MFCKVFILLFTIKSLSTAKNAPRPNILLMVADDMGWGDLGVNVPYLPSNTPHLDNLAENGIRLYDFHSAASLCTPSRAALLTGRMGLRTGVVGNFAPESIAGLPRNETTLSELLKKSGYRTAMFGKWHLGTQPGYHPMDRGFDRYLGVPYSLDMGCTTPPGLDLPPRRACPSKLGNNHISNDESSDPLALPLYRNRQIAHQPVNLKSLAKHYASFGRHFILENSSSEPFFLYAAFSHVHVPIAHSNRFDNATGRGIFANTLAEMDWVAGQLANAVTKRGDSTLIWFTSDNGPWDVKCMLAGESGPFIGGWQRNVLKGGGGSAAKTTVWEAGHRVPAFIHWSHHITPGYVSEALLSALDIFPTIADLVGIPLPPNREFDGISLADEIQTNNIQRGHTELFHPNSGSAGPYGDIGAVRVGQYKTVYYAGGSPACLEHASAARKLSPPLAFDLNLDLSESNPIQNTTLSDAVIRRANEALNRLLESVRNDNTSTTDYTKNSAARPCCSATLPSCMCPWD